MIPLFSYGSNHSKQLEKRTGAKHLVGFPGTLKNHERIFAGYSNRWKGGVASVVPKRQSVVHGTVYFSTKDQLDRLDVFEEGYTRECKDIHVELSNLKRKIKCVMYVKVDVSDRRAPSANYLKAIEKTIQESRSSLQDS